MDRVTFTVNGEPYSVEGPSVTPWTSLNDYLRSHANLRGTKAMCHEGGCGACIVSVSATHPLQQERRTFSVNSCLVCVLSCNDWDITTIEGIGDKTAGYHTIQTRLASFNGTQCGFCTPGWIMNMYSLYKSKNQKITMKEVENSFASNMCRCTGYRPILDAFKSFATDVTPSLACKIADLEDLDRKACGENRTCAQSCDLSEWCVVNKLNRELTTTLADNSKWYKVYKLEDVFKILNAEGYDSYRLIAGNTGQGVYHIDVQPRISIDISSVSELCGTQMSENMVLGAGMTLTDLMATFKKMAATNQNFKYLERLHDHLDLVAHVPVRNIGTIGGNLALKNQYNNFPSDLFLIFDTVGAYVTLVDKTMARSTISMTEFLTADLKEKIICNVKIPPLSSHYILRTYKIMPRAQNAHALVNAGFLFRVNEQNQIQEARIAYGNIARTFSKAIITEQLLVGKSIHAKDTLKSALVSLATELQPVDDPPEPSPAYRKHLALALFYKCMLSLCPSTDLDPKNISGGTVFDRPVSKGTQTFDTERSLWPLNQPMPKLEAATQCAGAKYADDIPTQHREVHAAFVLSTVGRGDIDKIDASAALKTPGVIAFYTDKDIPGKNSFVPLNVVWMKFDEEVLCSGKVLYYGQPIGIIAANTRKLAKRAAKLVHITYKNTFNPVLSIREALAAADANDRVRTEQTVEPASRGDDVKKVIKGTFQMPSQYHYYMETQTCVAVPTEDGLDVLTASQWIDHTHVAIAQVLNIPENSINVTIRRVGGAYGGKASRSSQVASACALVASKLRRPVRFTLDLQTNMAAVGKRADCLCDYEVGVNDEGVIQYLTTSTYADCGITLNDSPASDTVRTMVNLYDGSRWGYRCNSVRTDKASNTWCRAPGTTEGTAFAEIIMEKIAFAVKKDPIDVRIANIAEKNEAVKEMIESFKIQSDYTTRQQAIDKYNDENRWRKRAMNLVAMSYPIAFSGNFAVTISVYHGDGTVAISSAGIEMGQGINTKVAQVCAHTLGISLDKISVKATNNFVTPNGMATNGSITSESVCYAVLKACAILTERLEPLKADNPTWEGLVQAAYKGGYNLQTSYMTSELDALEGYSVYGVTVAEVELDVLTGAHQVLRVDILEDTGQSMNPDVDVGQIEGAFVMGIGLWTCEHLTYDRETGRLLTDRTWTYKVPGAKDIPIDMRVYFRRNSPNPVGVLRSKATGEPALVMAVAVPLAIHKAATLARKEFGHNDVDWLHIDVPYTMENIVKAISPNIEAFKFK